MGCCPHCRGSDIELVDTESDFDSIVESWLCGTCECEWDWTTYTIITAEGKALEEED